MSAVNTALYYFRAVARFALPGYFWINMGLMEII